MKKIIFTVLAAATLLACETSLTDLNVDKKNPTAVAQGTLFANATVEFFDFMASPNVNVNNFRLWAQQWAQTTYADESNYELVERNVNGRTWNTLYATVIRDIREAKSVAATDPFLSADELRAQLAVMEVMEIFAWHVLVDIFGDIPYNAALGEDVTPAYDDDATIYADLTTRLDAAIADLVGDSRLGSADLIYSGDASSWRKVANSLKLRLAIRLADMDNAKAGAMVGEAVADGVLASGADDFELAYSNATPNTNPLWEDLIQSGRSDFVAANTMVDYMNDLGDPRLKYFYKDPVLDSTGTQSVFVGGVYGGTNAYNQYSHPGVLQEDPTFPSTVMSYTEVNFLLADAAQRGYNVGGEAEGFYNAGIESSILEWGGTSDEVAAYLAQERVAYATAAGDWKQKIAFQKWIALYDQGFEAWSTWRLYDSPALNIAAQAGTLPPTRFTYPVTEYSLNGESVEAAGSSIGGDLKTTKVFWDMN